MTDQQELAKPARSGWRKALSGNVLAMGLVSLFTDFSSEMMNPLLPFFIAGLVPVALAPIYIGLMEGVAEATSAFLKIFSGRISDKLRKRKALVLVGYGLSSLARPLMGAVGAGWQMVALKFVDRIGKGVRTSPRDALIGDSVDKDNRGLAFSFHRSMDHLGAVLGPLVAIGVLYLLLGEQLWTHPAKGAVATPPDQMHAMRILFFVAVIPGVAAVAAIIFGVREIAPQAKPKTQAAGSVPPADGAPQAHQAVEVSAWKQLPRKFYLFVAIVSLFALGNSSDLFILYLGSKYFGMGLLEVIVLWIVLHVSKIFFSLPGGVLSDRLGRRPVIIAGWAIYALVYLGFAVLNPVNGSDGPDQASVVVFWALVLAYGFYYGMTEGAEKALVTDFVPSENRGTAFGIYSGATGMALLPASLLFGSFWVWADATWGEGIGRTVAFGIGAALAGGAAILLALLLSTTRKDAPETAPSA